MAHLRESSLPVMTGKSNGAAAASQPAGANKISDYFGCNVFGAETMKLLLPKETYRRGTPSTWARGSTSSECGRFGDEKLGDLQGATHYCHWLADDGSHGREA